MHGSRAVIDPAARIHASAELDSGVSVGSFTIIGPGVRIGNGTAIGPHCVLVGNTTIGNDNTIHPFCSIGSPPQDKKYRGENTRLEIGDRNTIREYCSINTGTVQDAGVTRIGHDNWIMAYVHVAHDCQIGNQTIFANNAQLAGHVRVDDHAILGGFTVVHQFVSIGAHSLTAMGTILLQDLPPYVTAAGNAAAPHGINSEGLKRRGFSPASIERIRRAYKILYRSGLTLTEARARLQESAMTAPEVETIVEFLSRSRRGIVR